jgi:hypothetical protein
MHHASKMSLNIAKKKKKKKKKKKRYNSHYENTQILLVGGVYIIFGEAGSKCIKNIWQEL